MRRPLSPLASAVPTALVLWTIPLIVCRADPILAREIHVAVTGDDEASGDAATPLRSIGRATSLARPGDTVTVHAGVYRERVAPARGGTSEETRIVYRAAPGEDVSIRGSERVTGWKPAGPGVWTAEIPNSTFGDYNPYALRLSGGWLNYGDWHHRGDVYLDGEALCEVETAAEVASREMSWHAAVRAETTILRAHFGATDPNRALTEINVRELLFFPQRTGISYITVRGFHFAHAAANWAPPVIELQTGAVGPRMGRRWIIEGCRITNARCVGIILGQAPGVDYDDIDAYGDHVVRGNWIRRCGQAGIAGQKGATRSLVVGNLIEETNYRREFGGWETAAIKFHNSVDTTIEGNLIRGVHHQMQGAFGIWIDYGNQGTRISRNIIHDTQAAAIFLEMNHGPTLVDANVVLGGGVRSNSEATVFAHNLFVDCGYVFHPDLKRRSRYFKPHTTIAVGRKAGTAQDDQWWSNVFVRSGLERVEKAAGYRADWNVHLAGAGRGSFEGAHSVVGAYVPKVSVEDRPSGVTIAITMDETPERLRPPPVDSKLVGVLPTVGQTIEDRSGRPVVVDRDVHGRPYPRPVPGPLADVRGGENRIVWDLQPPGSGSGAVRAAPAPR